jgi:hypothetical protein
MTEEDRFKSAYKLFKPEIFEGVYDFASRRGYRYHPYLGYIHKPFDKSNILKIEKNGFRSHSSQNKANNITLMLGGSLVFGSYSPSNDTTIPSLLETEFNKFSSITNIINCGIGGHIINQHFILLTQLLLLKYKPKLVICISGYNDFLNFLSFDNPGFPQNKSFEKIIDIFCHENRFKGVVSAVKNRLFFKKNISKRQYSLNDYENCLGDHVNNYVFQIKLINHICNSNKTNFVNVLQPCLVESKKKFTKTESEIINSIEFKYPFYREISKMFFDSVSKEITNLNDFKHTYFDLRSLFDNEDSQIFIDPCHMGDRGNDLISKFLFNKIGLSFLK